jgi:twinkle protein|tara:strand:+ start:4063 stop:5721 length:1659 start_codon:yes stop_codon:yes gene_type:complete
MYTGLKEYDRDNSHAISRKPCFTCDSSDANVEYDDGHHFCYSCETYFPPNYKSEGNMIQQQNSYQLNKNKSFNFAAIADRKISEKTCREYGVTVSMQGSMITDHRYEYYDKDNNHIATKFRQTQDKKFYSEGNMSGAVLFGQNKFNQGGKYITVCEGELDAMSAYELLGSKWPVVSIKNGAASALKNCQQALDYLNKFDQIVLCFDNDKQGREAEQKVAKLFEPNKCKIMSLDLKDANEYLKTGQRERFVNTWWNARTYTPVGIINLADLGTSLYDEKVNETCLYPWSKMNEKTYGMRTGELVTFTSGAGMGKSSIMRELMHHIMCNTEDNIGVLALEENTRNTAFNIMSVEANARLYIKEIREQYTQEQLNEWQKKTIGSGRFFAFDHFGSIENDEILDRVRYMAKALECKWVFLDHLSILVSGQEDNGDERKSIDILMTKLRSLVEETGIALLLVSHLRRPSGDRGHEDGREVSLSHLRGSASIAHLSDAVIALERNQQADDDVEANTTTIRILKNRYTGDTGVACHLHYDKDSGRMSQIDNPLMDDEDE